LIDVATKIINVNQIKSGSYLLVDGVACRVTDAQSSKSGKHGHAKIRITAIGLLDNRKRELILPSGHTVEVPIIEKKTAQVLSISGDTVNVMDNESYETFDLKIPEELKDQVIEGCNVLYWDVMGEKVMKQVKGAD
jgi:translation initiation factor 5A